jgi:Fe-S-cluster formation regulator IscX/YfhJ
MPRTRNTARPTKSDDKPRTVQRTYRFDTTVFEAFEDDCATHLSNPKRVIEALILHWLDADKEERAVMAHKHRQRIGSASRDEE